MIIAICGGSCSGKSTMARLFRDACILSMDDFYKGKSRMQEPYNFDEPQAIDLSKLSEVLKLLKDGAKEVSVPNYNMITSEPDGTKKIVSKKLIILEGIFSLYTKELRDLCDLKIYLDVPVGERLLRRIGRDTEKGRSEAETVEWSKKVDLMHNLFVESQKKFADLVIHQNT